MHKEKEDRAALLPADPSAATSTDTLPDIVIEEAKMEPHNEAAVDHWDCVCLECQISSRVERYPEIATPAARLEALRSVVAWDIWPIDVDCLSVQEHAALKTATKILPALLRDLEYFHQVGSGNTATPEHSDATRRSEALK